MPQTLAAASNDAQIDYWNTTAGETWVRHQRQLDRQLEVLGLEAMRVLAPATGERVLDVGCGCGETTLELSAHVGPSGAVVGVDISEPMLAVARRRNPPAGVVRPSFRNLDAQTADFRAADLGHGAFDGVFSRFGVMFFADPVAAFANVRAALRPRGRLAFVCWRAFQDNPWMREPMAAAAPLLPPLPPVDPNAPGPFAFADDARVRAILGDAGYSGVAIDPFDANIGGASLDETVKLTLQVGPLGRILREIPDMADAVVGAVRTAIQPYETAKGVLMPAAVWIVSATA
ncbi:MAG TPA: class I SAM-dependent methyltransferase [Caulobacteraceae bacterium]|nr:class I SAM-dependent methyltransferase [Caulobacteraceae bacterium]